MVKLWTFLKCCHVTDKISTIEITFGVIVYQGDSHSFPESRPELWLSDVTFLSLCTFKVVWFRFLSLQTFISLLLSLFSNFVFPVTSLPNPSTKKSFRQALKLSKELFQLSSSVPPITFLDNLFSIFVKDFMKYILTLWVSLFARIFMNNFYGIFRFFWLKNDFMLVILRDLLWFFSYFIC